LKKMGVQTVKERIQKRRDAIMKDAVTRNVHEKCKNSGTASENLLWWEINCCSNDAAEALQQARHRRWVKPPHTRLQRPRMDLVQGPTSMQRRPRHRGSKVPFHPAAQLSTVAPISRQCGSLHCNRKSDGNEGPMVPHKMRM
jgi:hypothetical protein